MEVVAPPPEFFFHTAMNTPLYISAPSSPQNNFAKISPFFESLHHRHVSAPTSPTSATTAASAAAVRGSRRHHSTVPFGWEEKPGTPKSPSFDEKDDAFEFDFTFSFGFSDRHIERNAEELFDLGKIRPLKLPPRLCAPAMGEQGAKSPRSGGLLSPLRLGRNRRSKEELDPFVVAMMEATRSRKGGSFNPPSLVPEKGGRGWKNRLKEWLLFRSSAEGGRVSGGGKRNDFYKSGSLSSSSSSGSSQGKTGESSCESFGSEDCAAEKRAPAVTEEKKMAAPYKQTAFSVRGFGASFIRRWT